MFDVDSFSRLITLLHISVHNYHHQWVTWQSIDTKTTKVSGYQSEDPIPGNGPSGDIEPTLVIVHKASTHDQQLLRTDFN
jgi:hypothetical protein